MDLQKFFTGLDNLLNHKLSMEIVNGRDMNTEFSSMQQALRAAGSVAQIYQLLATFVVRNTTVTAIVKIPVIPNRDVEEFHLFQHLRLPILHDGHLMEKLRARR